MIKKEHMLSLVEHKGICFQGGSKNCCTKCPIYIDTACFVDDTYKRAVVWMKENYPDELMELLI